MSTLSVSPINKAKMKFPLYVAISVFVLSVDCAVLRPAANGIDKPNSNRDYHCPAGCERSLEESDLVLEPDPDEELDGDVSQSDTQNLLAGLPVGDVEKILKLADEAGLHHPVSNDKLGKRGTGSDIFPVGGYPVDDFINKAWNFLHDFIPHFGKRDLTTEQFVEEVISKLEKRDIGSLFPVGGDIISELVHTVEDILGNLVPKLGKRSLSELSVRNVDVVDDVVNVDNVAPKLRKRDIGKLFPVGGDIISYWVNLIEDLIVHFIPKFGKRDVGKLFPVGGDIISHWVNLIEDFIGQFVPKFGKRDVGKLFPVGGDIISHWVNLIEDFIGQFVPKFGKRDVGKLFPVGGDIISHWVNLIEDFIGQFVPKIGKRDIASLFPVGGNIVSYWVHLIEDRIGQYIPKIGKRDIGLVVPHFGKRDLVSSMRQERDLVMSSIETANEDLLKPVLQSVFNMVQRWLRFLLSPFM